MPAKVSKYAHSAVVVAKDTKAACTASILLTGGGLQGALAEHGVHQVHQVEARFVEPCEGCSTPKPKCCFYCIHCGFMDLDSFWACTDCGCGNSIFGRKGQLLENANCCNRYRGCRGTFQRGRRHPSKVWVGDLEQTTRAIQIRNNYLQDDQAPTPPLTHKPSFEVVKDKFSGGPPEASGRVPLG
jgi:hypothetical protein